MEEIIGDQKQLNKYIQTLLSQISDPDSDVEILENNTIELIKTVYDRFNMENPVTNEDIKIKEYFAKRFSLIINAYKAEIINQSKHLKSFVRIVLQLATIRKHEPSTEK